FKLPRDEVRRRVTEALDRFGLTDRAEHSPHTLSGGEKQMLALASVLVIQPDTIIADEPTTLLDLRNRRRIVRELMALQQQLIVVTHDLE
ncbi:ATP-binding cassette domain-containing protein, partial [Mycobacterium tuberculosis]|nr:ATP-binding cassette domain-containing protein [Mycobacterium tuberculosis]